MLGMCSSEKRGDTMSAYSEWKFGLITDAEYLSACREEEYTDRYWDDHPDEFNEEDVFEDDEIDEF